MKLKKLVACIALAYSSLSAQTLTQQAFETAEYSRSRALPSIKASSAYARGYTGKDSIIAILDSGIDVKNIEFSSRILAVKDFTSTGIQDTLGHGTHVAGIAAAAKNSVGMHGVAYDAKLLVGKVTSSGILFGSTAIQAASWAATSGADVANLSLNFRLSDAALKPTLIAPGVYKTQFTNTGTLPLGFNASQWKSAVPGEMVLVVAAGNDGTAWTGGLSQMATATDSNGNLLLGGRMIVAGNWNQQTNTSTGPNNNGAAHLCMVMVGTNCTDRYKMSDFYLLAPGTGITSAAITGVNSTGLNTMTGTSMAAPNISGAVAIVHQMWPQMSGSNIVRLLLATGDKTIKGYNIVQHGQGLLDLDRATRPIGQLAIPTTGRLTGPVLLTTNPLLLTGGSASIGNGTSVMVVDDYQRDFYLKGKSFTGYIRQAEFKPAQAAMPYLTRNNYTQFNNYTDRFTAAAEGYEVSLYRDTESSMFQLDIPVWADTKFVTGVFTEQMTWLGNMTNSFAGGGNNRPSTTHFSGLNFNKELHYGINTFGSVMHGITWTSSNSANIKNIGPVLSYTWNFGAEYKLPTSSIGAMVYQPVSVYKANADLTAPVGLDNEFNVVQNSRINLAADTKETRAGIFYKTKNFVAFIEHRQNFQGQYNVSNNAVGFNYSAKF